METKIFLNHFSQLYTKDSLNTSIDISKLNSFMSAVFKNYKIQKKTTR